METTGYAGFLEGAGNFPHFTFETPGFRRDASHLLRRFLVQVRIAFAPLFAERIPHIERFGSGQDGTEQGRCAFGISGVAHLERRGFARLRTEYIGRERTAGKTANNDFGMRAGEVEQGLARIPRRSADDAAVDEVHALCFQSLANAPSSLRRDGVGIQVGSLEIMSNDLGGQVFGGVGGDTR